MACRYQDSIYKGDGWVSPSPALGPSPGPRLTRGDPDGLVWHSRLRRNGRLASGPASPDSCELSESRSCVCFISVSPVLSPGPGTEGLPVRVHQKELKQFEQINSLL